MKKTILMLFLGSLLVSCENGKDDSEQGSDSLPKSICAETNDTGDVCQVVSNETLETINNVLLAQENKSVVDDETKNKLEEAKVKVYHRKIKATYYADKFNGRKTSNGDVFSQKKLTAAHNTLPLGSVVRVTNNNNSKSVIVIVNDRGGKKLGIDLSKSAMKTIEPNYVKKGWVNVKVELLTDKQNIM